ncbi:MAG TPA: DUF1501 domain-containing protein [Fimbriiglobus sp.]|jgi:hypothetical protein
MMPRFLTRREMLARSANGFGAVALTALLAEQARANGAKGTHFPATAKNVIFLYMDGGPSQVDTFDPKPALAKYNGQNPYKVLPRVEPTQFDAIGKVLASPWKFRQHGQSGLWVSDLFPHVAKCADDLAVVRSAVSNFSEHTSANYFLHTGNGFQGRPSAGSWVTYGLGSEARDLPGFVVLDGGLIPPGGLDNFNSGFLPAAFQGSVFRAGDPPVANAKPLEPAAEQTEKRRLTRRLDELANDRFGSADAIEAAIANAETAFRMQAAVPGLTDLSKETKETKALYGLDAAFEHTRTFGRQCLLARRLVERGVRFVELTCPHIAPHDRWDQHGGLKKGHEDNARGVDQPIGALLTDLKARGLLRTTLVFWAGEFGRTPFAQGSDGRDHNPYAFSVWFAGGGAKGGVVHGVTDDFGYKVVKDKVEMYDLHATMLHFLGVDHTKQTFRFGGRDMRLTDVHGNVIRPIVA